MEIGKNNQDNLNNLLSANEIYFIFNTKKKLSPFLKNIFLFSLNSIKQLKDPSYW